MEVLGPGNKDMFSCRLSCNLVFFRFDYLDHDGKTAALCGDWDDGNADVPTQEDVECCSCHVVGLQHFSGTQLKWGEARRCYSCVCT